MLCGTKLLLADVTTPLGVGEKQLFRQCIGKTSWKLSDMDSLSFLCFLDGALVRLESLFLGDCWVGAIVVNPFMSCFLVYITSLRISCTWWLRVCLLCTILLRSLWASIVFFFMERRLCGNSSFLLQDQHVLWERRDSRIWSPDPLRGFSS